MTTRLPGPHVIRSAYADDPDYRELIELFVSEVDARLVTLRDCAAEARWSDLRTLAHQFKGAGAGYGFAELSERASVLEKACVAGVESEIRLRFDALVEYLQCVTV